MQRVGGVRVRMGGLAVSAGKVDVLAVMDAARECLGDVALSGRWPSKEPVIAEHLAYLELSRAAVSELIQSAIVVLMQGALTAGRVSPAHLRDLRVALDCIDFNEEPTVVDAPRTGEWLSYVEINRLREWHDRYQRDVEGLNNEGDPIGGDPPRGLRHLAEERNEAFANLLNLTARLGEHPEDYEGPCWCATCRSYMAEDCAATVTP